MGIALCVVHILVYADQEADCSISGLDVMCPGPQFLLVKLA